MAISTTFARTVADIAITAGLLTTLALPALGPLVGFDTSNAPNERRTKAPLPAVPQSQEAVQEFPGKFDAFFRDHFGFRSSLIRLRNRAALALETRPTDAVKVIVGRNGWLYYSGNNVLSYVEGRNLFSDDALRAWARCLQERGRWLEKRGIRYLVVIAPGKPSIYPEYLPAWVRPSTAGTRLDQFTTAAKGLPNVEVLDLRRTLREAKRQARVYDATGTHWNDLGAYAAYVAIIERLARWFPNERPSSISAFELTWKRYPGGDLAEMVGLEDLMTEMVPFLVRRTPSVVQRLDGSAYTAFPALPAIVTEKAMAGIRRAVVFRDSFTNGLMPFLPEHFGRSVVLWTNEFDAGVVNREHPDVVIQEIAERLLSDIGPSNPPDVRDGSSMPPSTPQGAQGNTGSAGAERLQGALSPLTLFLGTGVAGSYTGEFWGANTPGSSYGVIIKAGTSASDYAFAVQNRAQSNLFFIRGDGQTTFYNGITERARPTAMGDWIAPSYSRGDFTVDTGTITVDPGDVETFQYSLVGKTMSLQFNINTFSLSSTPGAVRIRVPGGFTVSNTTQTIVSINDNFAGWIQAIAKVEAGGNMVYVMPNTTETGSWSVAANSSSVRGQITIPLQ